MSIEWAPVSVDGSHDPAVRRHARSLAMRQYRQRQKAEMERKNSPAIKSNETEVPAKRQKTRPRQRNIAPAPNGTTDKKRGEVRSKSGVFNAVSWRDNVEERIQDPQVMADSLMLCKRYLQWLHPDNKLTDAGFALSMAQRNLPDPLLIAASHLVAARHLDAAHFRSPGKKSNEYKNEVLSCLKTRLNANETPTSAEVVSAIVCLLHFELCDGNEEALVHLKGIKALMGITDSLNDHIFASCAMSLEMGDLIHALMFSKKAEFVALGKQNTAKHPTYSSYHAFVLTSELDQLNKVIAYPSFNKVDSMMHDVSRSIESSLDESKTSPQRPAFQDLARSMDTLLHENKSCDLELFVQAAKATITIIYRYAVLKHAVNDLENQSQIDPIINAMLHVPSERWRVLKYFRLFMLLSALCAAEEPRRRSFCEAHLVRAMLNIGPEAWLDTRKFVVKFIDNFNAVRGPPAANAEKHVGMVSDVSATSMAVSKG